MALFNSIKHKARLARKLSLSEWLLLVEAWWILFGFHLALRSMSYDRLNKVMPARAKEISDSPSLLVFAERLKQLVEMSSHLHLSPMACLVKSFALRWMLLRRGVPVQLRIGVSKTINGMRAHAWVELKGEPVAEAEDVTERFRIMSF